MGAPASESVRTDANLQPQATESFQNTSFPSLVNYDTTFIFPADSLISSTSSRDPTLEQEQAIAILNNHHNSDIIAWHKLSQSTEPGLRHRDEPGGLSIQEIHAISILRDCSRTCLLQWLESGICIINFQTKIRRLTALTADQRSSGNADLPNPGFAAAVSSRQTRRPLARFDRAFDHLSLVKSVKAVSPHLSNNPYSALTATQHTLVPVQTISTASSRKTSALVRPANPNHKYWCTVCGDRSYKNSDDWKKHEKGHEANYVCMLKGLFEITEDGRRCVLCGALNQADSHLLAHNTAPCVKAADRPWFKRRYDMVSHLKDAHHVTTGGRCIADKWRCESSKKAWSCGFCIDLSPTHHAYLKHIGTEHFEKGQKIDDWDFTKVILGLLLQPEIREAWQHLDPFRPLEPKWNRLGNENLKYRLEMGLTEKETSQSLARAAYDNADYDWSSADKDAVASAITMNTVPGQYTSKDLLPPFQDYAVASGEVPVESQSWSSSQNQASQIPRSSPAFETQGAHGTSALSSPPAHLVPALDRGSMWKSMASDTDVMNSTRPTTPLNEKFNPADPSIYSPWGGYSYTPDPAHSDHETYYYKSNNNFDRSAHPHPDSDVGAVSSTLKRPRDSAFPPFQALSRKSSLNDRPKKKAYRKRSEESETASRSLGIEDGQRETYDDEDTGSEMGAKMYLKDGLYK